jgi:hypothetical protein
MEADQKHLVIKAAIYEMGLLFNQQPNDEKITAYAKALQNYTPQQIRHAFNQVILSGSAFFPSLAEILAHLRPKEISSDDIGNFIANEVIEKVINFGSYRLREAFDALSDPAKQVIGLNTYLLTEIANSERDQLPMIRAQIRGLAKAANEAHKAGKKNERLERVGISTAGTDSIGAGKLIALSFDGYNPREGA